MAQTQLKAYSARQVLIRWGNYEVDGFSDDNMITFEYNSELAENVVTADGLLATSVTADRTGTVTIELMQTSLSSAVFAGVLEEQNAASNNNELLIKKDLVATDPSGAVLCTARGAFLQKAPSIGLGVNQKTHEWTFYCESLDFSKKPVGLSAASSEDLLPLINAGIESVKSGI